MTETRSGGEQQEPETRVGKAASGDCLLIRTLEEVEASPTPQNRDK